MPKADAGGEPRIVVAHQADHRQAGRQHEADLDPIADGPAGAAANPRSIDSISWAWISTPGSGPSGVDFSSRMPRPVTPSSTMRSSQLARIECRIEHSGGREIARPRPREMQEPAAPYVGRQQERAEPNAFHAAGSGGDIDNGDLGRDPDHLDGKPGNQLAGRRRQQRHGADDAVLVRLVGRRRFGPRPPPGFRAGCGSSRDSRVRNGLTSPSAWRIAAPRCGAAGESRTARRSATGRARSARRRSPRPAASRSTACRRAPRPRVRAGRAAVFANTGGDSRSGSANRMSMPRTRGLPAAMRLTRSATSVRGHGHWPNRRGSRRRSRRSRSAMSSRRLRPQPLRRYRRRAAAVSRTGSGSRAAMIAATASDRQRQAASRGRATTGRMPHVPPQAREGRGAAKMRLRSSAPARHRPRSPRPGARRG